MTLLELAIAMAVIGVIVLTMSHFILTSHTLLITNQDRSFAIQKSLAMMGELRAYAEAHESSGGASTLDSFDDGVNTSPMLTTDTTLSYDPMNPLSLTGPIHILSGNIYIGDLRWRYSRRITVRKFSSYQESNVRIVTVKVFLTQPGANDASLMSELTSVITTQGENTPTTQVYDIYLLSIENIPGWWVYMAYLKPFVENALSDMESRNPGMSFRTHWITKAAYGRDPEYKPYFNNSVDSNQDINWVYFYPGTMPSGSAVDQYYIPSGVKARVNIDGTTTNDYNVATNPYPYTLADQYNHGMRYPDELALYEARSNGGTNEEELTYRLLLDDMIANPGNYRNAIIMNLHGELLPMPSIRNYSDAAKAPASYPGWRAVTHPENISYTATADMNLRVYAYTDTNSSATQYMTVPISIVLSDTDTALRMDFTQTAGDITVTAIQGGTNQSPQDGSSDIYAAVAPASTTAGTGQYVNQMYYTITHDAAISSTIIKLYNTPLMTPNLVTQGLGDTRKLYGREYIPCPVESLNNFSRSLTSTVNAWDAMASAPSAPTDGGGLVYCSNNGRIYALRGTGSKNFWCYYPSTNVWNNPTDPEDTASNIGAGGTITYDSVNNHIYAFRGGATSFWRYYVATNVWNTVDPTDHPTWGNVGNGGSLAYGNNCIYALRGNASTDFSRYNIGLDNWTVLSNTPNAIGLGGAMVYVNNFIYVLRGANTNNFYRYDVLGGSGWATMQNTPDTVGSTGGGSLVYPGFGDFIYALRGSSSDVFWRYSISTNTWSVMSPVTVNGTSWSIAGGGALVYAPSTGYIYGTQGNGMSPFFRCCGAPKNTARWIITISAAAADREFSYPGPSVSGANKLMAIKTIIGEDFLHTGVMWPTKMTPTNISTTYIYRNYTDTEVPFSERYQFQGDPRHCPYADIKKQHRYNWYFDNFRCSAANATGEWYGFSKIDTSGDDIDGWHGAGGTSGDMMEIDVPRFFSFFKTAITGANCVYTTITGWSYYYMGLGNEIGYDSANGFANSIPVSKKPFDGSSGSRNEQSITTDQTGGVKYIREKMTQYWWGLPWLGELYPDKDNGGTGANVYVNQWAVNGNLNTPTGTGEPQAGKFVRIRRQDIQTGAGTPRAKDNSLPRGTLFYNAAAGEVNLACVRRTRDYGCTSLFNIGTTTSTFCHEGDDGTNGTIAAAGTEMANNYNFTLPTVAGISRPFKLNNDWGGVPTEFSDATYSGIRCSSAVISRFYGHNNGTTWEGSALLRLQNPSGSSTSNAFIVANGLDRTVETGSAFIARYALLSLMHSFLTCGIDGVGGTPSASRIGQLPRLEIKTPNVATELDNPTSISITWATTWKRWDGQKYTTAYADTYVEPGDDANLKYIILYSRDNGDSWRDLPTDSPFTPVFATPGKPNPAKLISDLNNGGNEGYLWDVSNTTYFPEGSYIIMIEVYRNNQPCHYSYHQQKIYLNR